MPNGPVGKCCIIIIIMLCSVSVACIHPRQIKNCLQLGLNHGGSFLSKYYVLNIVIYLIIHQIAISTCTGIFDIEMASECPCCLYYKGVIVILALDYWNIG